MQRPFYSVKKGCRTMEHSISSAQWYQLDELTATIYNTSFDHLFEVVLKGVKQLVPYSHSLTYLLRSEDGLNAVSYTHLDVYKRQAFTTVPSRAQTCTT